MDVYELQIKEEPDNAVPADEQSQTLPVRLYLPEPKNESEEEPKKTKRGAAARILSLFFSVIFCGVSLLYIASRVVALSDRHDERDIKQMLINEVYPDAVIETAAPEIERKTDELSAIPFEPIPEEAEKVEDVPGSYPIVGETLANYDLLTSLSNETSYEPDMEKLLFEARGTGKCAAIYEEFGTDAPVVLIVHTHGTEAYTPEGRDTYTTEDSFRTNDRDLNVVSVSRSKAFGR